ncbi:YbaB/EbfC family nucleoid-associated protein [Saccharopolyspora erythraea]|uniref:YbaB/EbfC family nucleoid-associated protein n=1 Tax=Saccharopolyspora erythraea TaxID=1836 RepID=UPI001BA8CEC0|nr:YbaB/EbfC family nucleoid-associated protein [Saccharopolyspora erythraea]QUH05206.1 YbaB/EbfC family nucleoid-associated protein [Saccharopolyspora erythraea]
MFGDTSATERMVREWQERATERAEKFNRMSEQVEQISVTESSRDGTVELTVASNGILTGIQIAESASARPMSQLSAEIMRTLRVAQSRIPELMERAVADTVGSDDSAGQHIVGQLRARFPEPPEEDQDDQVRSRHTGVQEMDYRVEDDHEPPSRPAPPRQAPGQAPSRPPQRRRPDDDFDEDYGSGSFLR